MGRCVHSNSVLNGTVNQRENYVQHENGCLLCHQINMDNDDGGKIGLMVNEL